MYGMVMVWLVGWLIFVVDMNWCKMNDGTNDGSRLGEFWFVLVLGVIICCVDMPAAHKDQTNRWTQNDKRHTRDKTKYE